MTSPSRDPIKSFDSVGNNHHAWRLSADELLAAARVLRSQRDGWWEGREVKTGDPIPDEGRGFGVEMMLVGLGIECMFKGLWVKAGNRLASSGRYVPVPGFRDQHDLGRLAAAVRFPVNTHMSEILKRLTASVKSGGRYPIPIQATNESANWWRYPTDDVALKNFIVELRGRLAE